MASSPPVLKDWVLIARDDGRQILAGTPGVEDIGGTWVNVGWESRDLAHQLISSARDLVRFGQVSDVVGMLERAMDLLQMDHHRAEARIKEFTNPIDAARDALHPKGRCLCGGEGDCEWCQLYNRRNNRDHPLDLRVKDILIRGKFNAED